MVCGNFYYTRSVSGLIFIIKLTEHVLDMGVYNEDVANNTEYKRANERIIVSGAKDWELPSLENILSTSDRIFKNKYYFTFSEKLTFEMIKSNMEGLQCYQAPYNPDPFHVCKECESVFRELLKEVLPNINKPNFKYNTKHIFNLLKNKIGMGDRAENQA